jgi:hypothetical protein
LRKIHTAQQIGVARVRNTGARSEATPTRAERIKFILRERSKGTVVIEGAQPYMAMVEDRLSAVVTATFNRGNAATHAGAEHAEVSALLPYLNALLRSSCRNQMLRREDKNDVL